MEVESARTHLALLDMVPHNAHLLADGAVRNARLAVRAVPANYSTSQATTN